MLREQRGLPGCAEYTSELCGHAFNAAAVLKYSCVVGQLGLGFSSQARWRGRGKGVAASVCTRLMRMAALESLLQGKWGLQEGECQKGKT